MSNEIKETCREYPGRLISLNLAFESRYETLTECGIDVEGISDSDPKTKELLEVARRRGSSTILSKEDALDAAMAQLSKSQPEVIQKRAEKFLDDAKALIEKIKAGQKPVAPKVPSAPKL